MDESKREMSAFRMSTKMGEIVGNIFHRRDNGEPIKEIFKQIIKDYPESWQTIMWHYQRLDGQFSTID